MSWKPWLVIAILLSVTAPVSGQTTSEDLADYLWVIELEDPADDHTGPTPVTTVSTPGTYNKEDDIRMFEVTDDETTFIVRVTIGTCDFEVPSGFSFVTAEITAGGNDWEMGISFEDGCTNAKPFEADSVNPTTASNSDALIPGLRVETDPANNQLYLFSDYADNGLVAGDSISWDRVHTGRQFAGRYTFGMDEVQPPSFVVGSGVELNLPTGPETVYEDVGQELHKEIVKQNATTARTIFNMTVDGDYEAFAIGSMSNGSLEMILRSDAGEIYNGSVTPQTNTSAGPFAAFNLTGNLTVQMDLVDFVGSVQLTIAPAVSDEDPGVDTGNATVDDPVHDHDDHDHDGNGTEDPLGSEPVDKESPAPAILAVLASLVVLARRRR